MISRYRVSLDGKQMDSVNDNILILDVKYNKPVIERPRVSTANLDGYDTSDEQMTERAVTVTFQLRIYDPVKRNTACQAINTWAAAGGKLRISDREKQYLNVICDAFADIASVRNWTDPLTIAFITKENPHWMSDDQKTVTLAGKNSSGTLRMDGNTGNAMVSVTATAGATVSSFRVTAGSTTISLTGLSVAAGQKIVIDYLKDRYLRIMANGKSVMARRSASSSDLLLVPCGANTKVSFTSSASMASVVFSARGVWR